MAAASPPPTSVPVPSPPPAPAAAAAPRSRAGEIRDQGTIRRDSVDAAQWSARGAVKVTGDVNVGQAVTEGTVSIGGKLTANAFRSHGALEVEGPVEVAGSFAGSGQLRAALTLHAVEADLRGASHVLGAVTVDQTLTVHGNLSAPSLAVGAFQLNGTAEIPGDLVGRSVSAHFTNPSALGTVRASTVKLSAKLPNLVEKVLGRQMAVTVRRVEADTVVLEGVDVQFVRSPQISLGRAAHVTEYEGTIVRRHPSSRVGFESRSPRPYGLTR
ncbi:MAG: hypothetical protein WB788_04305 [Thermoplasmata archaeon]